MQKMYSVLALITIVSTLLSCFLGLYFINDRNITDKLFYGMAPMIVFFTLGLIFAGPIILYQSTKEKDSKTKTIMVLTATTITGMPIGGFITGKLIYPLLGIQYLGLLNFIPMILVGALYVRVVAILIKKPADYISAI